MLTIGGYPRAVWPHLISGGDVLDGTVVQRKHIPGWSPTGGVSRGRKYGVEVAPHDQIRRDQPEVVGRWAP